ncbi:MAG: M43 family zinc metalloprotease, partial [Bacteroidetes bacterium]|nr:M43 family zinc metalloprotease [Bacteroidota bacterium]
MPTLVILLALIFLVPFISPGQQRCPVVPTEQESKIFEDWLRQKMEAKRLLFKTYEALSTAQELYTIPVVVHVIHNGEAQGDGTNISNAQIFSQIDVLNEDFRRLNADTINTPSIFQSVVADAEIQFELAKRDPEGLPTNGIVRVQGSQAEWDFGDEDDLKAQSYWPANDYLNMWVANLKSPLLGFATFPISDLQGLENEFTNNELLDGIVTGHRFFGSVDKGNFDVLASPFNLGRTTTHEVGHFLGLRHIWGDGGCSLDDFCDDTPRAEDEHISCPTTDLITCGSRDMYENYLDFTEDGCMNIFTLCQRDRMRAVLENSPRRKSLLASNALVAPTLVSNNMGIRNIISPVSNICVANFIPGVEVRNYGTNTVTSFRVRVSLDGQTVETLNVSGSLDPLDIANITFSDINLGNPGTHMVSYEIINTNGQTDQVASNNLAEIDVVFAAQGFSTITEQFESLPNDWFVSNP